VELQKKVRFIFRQKWFWGLIVLIVLLLSFPNIVMMILLFSSDRVVFMRGRSDWGALDPKQGLINLTQPIDNVIVTHTNDENESCRTQVNFKLP
jgi:hypothetical protein